MATRAIYRVQRKYESMAKQVICTNCGSNYHYQTFCTLKKRKPISQRGKHAKLWEAFRDKVAKPYLDKRYGRICNQKHCAIRDPLDVDHVKERGSNPGLRYDVKNVQYLCRSHHREKTDGKKLKYKHRI